MRSFQERFVVDEQGRRVAVLLDIDQYEKVLDELEELDSLRAFDAAKNSGDETVPFEAIAASRDQRQD
jgi:hypothetical protein